MRRLATELGVAAPSLYHHVASKSELVDSLVERVGSEADASWFADRPWDEALLRWGRTYYAALARHPRLAPLFVGSPGRSAAALRRTNDVHGGLVAAGWSRREATEIGAAVRFLVMGAVWGSVTEGFSDDPAVYAGSYPHLREAHRIRARGGQVGRGGGGAGPGRPGRRPAATSGAMNPATPRAIRDSVANRESGSPNPRHSVANRGSGGSQAGVGRLSRATASAAESSMPSSTFLP